MQPKEYSAQMPEKVDSSCAWSEADPRRHWGPTVSGNKEFLCPNDLGRVEWYRVSLYCISRNTYPSQKNPNFGIILALFVYIPSEWCSYWMHHRLTSCLRLTLVITFPYWWNNLAGEEEDEGSCSVLGEPGNTPQEGLLAEHHHSLCTRSLPASWYRGNATIGGFHPPSSERNKRWDGTFRGHQGSIATSQSRSVGVSLDGERTSLQERVRERR